MTTAQIKLEVSVSKAMLAEAIGARFDAHYYLDPMVRHEVDTECHAWVDSELGDIGAFFTESNLGRRAHSDERYVLVGGIQPNLIQGMLLGAEFLPNPSGDADISPACWAGHRIDELPPPEDMLRHDLIKLFDSQIAEVRSRGDLIPVPPFFWDRSGRAAVHGALTTTQKFLGESVFVDILDDPERIRGMMEWVSAANIALVQHFARECGNHVTGIHVGECSSCMIGPDQWAEFVAPTLNRMGEAVAPVRLHSCGSSNHIIEKARLVDRLYSLDLGGETSLARVRDVFGPTLPVSVAPRVRDLTAGSTIPVLNWLDQLIADNAGGDLTLLLHIEPQYDLEVVRALCRRIHGPAG